MIINGNWDHDLAEKLVNYLNFFEFVASLWKMDQLSKQEIILLFDYYIRLLKRHPEVLAFLEKHSFENLQALIKEITSNGGGA
jgi:hypothetical protein